MNLSRFFAISSLILAVVSSQCVAAAARWTTYRSNILGLLVTVPSDWSPLKNKKALGFRYDDQAGGTAAIGFLRSSNPGATIEEQAEQEYEHEGKPAGWTKSPANVGGNAAIKMVGISKEDHTRKVIHYFVQTPSGVYLVQCQATADHWNTFGPIFSGILTRMKFLSQN